ncbi:MAG: helix-turn-helix domain-containing protein [Betaproteobacteria bacterium]
MSFEAMAWVANQKCPSPASKLVLFMLANYADERHSSFPSIERLSDLCGCHPDTVRRAIKQLESIGLLKVQPRYVQGKQSSNLYILGVANCGGRGSQITPPIQSEINNIKNNNKGLQKLGGYSQEFERWWAVYPRKDGSKKNAFESYQKQTAKKISAEELFKITERFAVLCRGKEPQYLPHAATWLNQERYETVAESLEIKRNLNALAG